MAPLYSKLRNIFLFLCVSNGLLAQQDALFSHFFFHNLMYHPGSTGILDRTDVSFTYRNQWTGYGASDGTGGAPISNLLLAETKIRAINSGIGMVLLQDQLGPLRQFRSNLNYAFHIQLPAGILGVGLKVGFQNVQLDPSVWRAAQENDNRLASIVSSDNAFDISSGFFYQSKTWFGGLSVLYLNQPSLFAVQQNNTQYASSIVRHAYATLGYQWAFSEQFTLIPSVFSRTANNVEALSFDANLRLAYLEQRFWTGLTYRLSEGMVAILGLSLMKNNMLRFSYAFDLNVAGRQAKAGTSHELYLAFSYPLAALRVKPAIRTPRFRF